MVKFEELEEKIQQSQVRENVDYSLSSDGQGKKTYIIISEKLKKSLRDTINPTLWEEWQVRFPAQGAKFFEYRKEQDGKFGFYRKSEENNSPDNFTILSEGKSSSEKEDFLKTSQSIKESRESIEKKLGEI